MRTIGIIAMALLILPATAWTQGAGNEEPKWVNVTGNVGGDTWGYAGVCRIVCVPGQNQDEVIAGISERGLWSSTDGGATWRRLGAEDKLQIAHRPHQFLFDPKDPKTFWVSGCYGAGLFKTTDGGRTFLPVGKLSHLDGVAIDFTDKGRTTLLVGHHEAARSIEKSADAGKTWNKLGGPLPIKPGSVAYSQKRNCLFIARSSEKKVGDAIFRGDLPTDADKAPKGQPAAPAAPAGGK